MNSILTPSQRKAWSIREGKKLANQQTFARKWRDLMRAAGYSRARRDISQSRRKIIKERDKVCRYCGEKSKVYHIDHVVPLSWGGSDYYWNLVLSCDDCNMEKSASLWKPHPIHIWDTCFSIAQILRYNDTLKVSDFI